MHTELICLQVGLSGETSLARTGDDCGPCAQHSDKITVRRDAWLSAPRVSLQVRHNEQLLGNGQRGQTRRRPVIGLRKTCILELAPAHHAGSCSMHKDRCRNRSGIITPWTHALLLVCVPAHCCQISTSREKRWDYRQESLKCMTDVMYQLWQGRCERNILCNFRAGRCDPPSAGLPPCAQLETER